MTTSYQIGLEVSVFRLGTTRPNPSPLAWEHYTRCMGRGQTTLRDQFAGIFGNRRGLGSHSVFHSEDYTEVLTHIKDEVAQALSSEDLSRADLRKALTWLRHPENAEDVYFRRALTREMLQLLLVGEYSLGVEAMLRVSNPGNGNSRARRIGTFGWPRLDALDELSPVEREEHDETIARLQDEVMDALLGDPVFTEGKVPKKEDVLALMRGELRSSMARFFIEGFSCRDAPKNLFTPKQLDALWDEHSIDAAWRPLEDKQVWLAMIEEAERAGFTQEEMSQQQRQRARRRLLDVVYEEVSRRLAAGPAS